ncbi:lipocalin family protein [Hymenobacter sp. BT730]|uniref:lipocalin family protein n=1 Tax=Hymenobacter sp. BT730 TaxID=3063332 RepID=UPI0026E0B9F4|nr:lipocalin family protein [Hymenobacter sp. BT730]
MRFFLPLLSLTALGVLSLTSCHKDEAKPQTAAQKLTAHPWRWSGYYDQETDGHLVDQWMNINPCAKDDIYTYGTDGSFQRAAGEQNCEPEYDAIRKGTWTLSQQDTILTQTETYPSYKTTFRVAELTETRLTLRIPKPQTNHEYWVYVYAPL